MIETFDDDTHWPVSKLDSATEYLARQMHVVPAVPQSSIVQHIHCADGVVKGVEAAAHCHGLEVSDDRLTQKNLEYVVRHIGHGFVITRDRYGSPRAIVIVGAGRIFTKILRPDFRILRLPTRLLIEHLHKIVSPESSVFEALKSVESDMDEALINCIQSAHVETLPIGRAFTLTPSPQPGIWASMWHSSVGIAFRRVAIYHGAQYLLMLLSWLAMAQCTMRGNIERGWLLTSVLLLASALPMRMASTAEQFRFSMELGSFLRRRIFHGITHLSIDRIRSIGVGSAFSTALDIKHLERFALSGGLAFVFATIEAVLAIACLVLGVLPRVHAILLFAFGCFFVVAYRRYHREKLGWLSHRNHLTERMLESMIAHRTRLVQGNLEVDASIEDRDLSMYGTVSAKSDRLDMWLTTAMPRLWLVASVAAVIVELINKVPYAPDLAFSVGGVLLGFHALSGFAYALREIALATITWSRLRPLLVLPKAPVGPRISEADVKVGKAPIVVGQQLAFRHQGSSRDVIRGLDISVSHHDRLRLDGPSGAGKSTLAHMLAGLKEPTSGILLLHGYDQVSWGSMAWKKRIVLVPQFHENHIFSATLVENLWLGKDNPPDELDMERTLGIVKALGLNDVVEKMPSGLFQMVGETGWALSHGEMSRVYIARALLQRPELILLDESFAALDAAILEKANACVHQNAKALIVIAHT